MSNRRRPFILNESYLHAAAKNVVAEWFRSSQDAEHFVQIGSVVARTNRKGGMCGVYVEYPIGSNGEGVDPCWDEVFADEIRVPSFNGLNEIGVQTRCVCDIALVHKGCISTAIEVVHKHPTPGWKRVFLADHGISLIEVQAMAVMHLTRRPDRLPLYVARGRGE